jgi:hypothetical protein
MEAMPQLFCAPASAVSLREALGEGNNHLFSIFSALTLQHFGPDAFADLPIEQGDFCIDGSGGGLFGLIDELTNFAKQGLPFAVDHFGAGVSFVHGLFFKEGIT